jgi:hypothetical protein
MTSAIASLLFSSLHFLDVLLIGGAKWKMHSGGKRRDWGLELDVDSLHHHINKVEMTVHYIFFMT